MGCFGGRCASTVRFRRTETIGFGRVNVPGGVVDPRSESCGLYAFVLMFGARRGRMLTGMIDLRADMPPMDWSDVDVSELPTGTVTLLLADVEGSTRLWETQPDEMRAAVARLDQAVSDAVAAHDGVRPVEQGEGDSFVIAFARAIRCRGLRARIAAGTTAPDPVAHRSAHRRGAAAG